jgi:hypothetical protein
MFDTQERIDIAIEALKKLELSHNNFVEFVDKFASEEMAVGKLTVDDGDFTAVCLGIHFYVMHRIIVAHHNLPSTIEYSFIAKHGDCDFSVFNMYLENDGRLYKDLDKKIFICDSRNDKYLAQNILYELAEKLLDSKIFAPSLVD